MPNALHITNGDGAGNLLKASGLAGDVLPWRDTMFEGPFPAGLDLEATSPMRASYLGAIGLPKDRVRRDFEERDAALRAARRYDQVTLWFEHDLLDQLQLLQLLDWFSGAALTETDIGMICIGAFPGIEPFRGVGQLTPDQTETLWPRRMPVTAGQLDLGRQGWAAFRSPDPRAIEAFLDRDLAPLPFLGPALRRHLEEFPSVRDGLGRTHRQLMRLIADGVSEPVDLFVQNMALETEMFIGDWSTYRRLGELFRVQEPLVQCPPFGVFRWPPAIALPMEDFRAQRLSLTEKGQQVLAGEAGARAMAGFDYWLGGVHFENGVADWLWNEAKQRLEPAA